MKTVPTLPPANICGARPAPNDKPLHAKKLRPELQHHLSSWDEPKSSHSALLATTAPIRPDGGARDIGYYAEIETHATPCTESTISRDTTSELQAIYDVIG